MNIDSAARVQGRHNALRFLLKDESHHFYFSKISTPKSIYPLKLKIPKYYFTAPKNPKTTTLANGMLPLAPLVGN